MNTKKPRVNRKKCANHPDRPSLPGFAPKQGMCQECWKRWNYWDKMPSCANDVKEEGKA